MSASRAIVVGAALSLVALGAGACGSGTPGVAVRRSNSNIEFGLPSTTLAQPAAAPQSVAPANVTQAGQVPAFDFVTTTTYDFGSGQPPVASQNPSSSGNVCPPAPYGASPDRQLGLTVDQPPAKGSYLWQIITSQPVSGTKTTFKTRHYVHYLIDGVTKMTTTPNPVPGKPATSTFYYDVVAPGAQGGTVVTTYEVKENAPQVSGSAGNVGQTEHAGTPDRGISLVSVVDKNAAGTTTSSFRPSAPVLLFPLDVQNPQSFNSAGVDPSNGASFSNQATVNGKTERVDACGKLVDGWAVTSTQSFSQPSTGQSFTASVDYAVAPQYGGILISSASNPTGSAQTETDQIGQLSPSPLPPGAS